MSSKYVIASSSRLVLVLMCIAFWTNHGSAYIPGLDNEVGDPSWSEQQDLDALVRETRRSIATAGGQSATSPAGQVFSDPKTEYLSQLADESPFLSPIYPTIRFSPAIVDYSAEKSSDDVDDLSPAIVEQLYEQLEQSKRDQNGDLQASETPIVEGTGEKISKPVYELNKHLPPSDVDSLMPPVNDPAEFEATLSYLTNAINHEQANSANRSVLIGSLVAPARLNSILSELQNEANGELMEASSGDNNDLADSERSFDLSQATPAPSYSYGGNDEYIDHPLALIGHQYVQGGAGEGRQLLGPDGIFENVQVVKTDRAVPSYCDPPNPCPIGYTAADGCLENFVNSASFSREYQAKQQCSCDNEHSLFNCAAAPISPPKSSQTNVISSAAAESKQGPSPQVDSDQIDIGSSSGGKLATLARAIENRFGALPFVRSLISGHRPAPVSMDRPHKQSDDNATATNADEDHLARVSRKSPMID